MIRVRQTEVLVIGGGPAGLSAALEAASLGCQVILVDGDLALGGQLIKQTHKFFGSKDERAGTRGFKISEILLKELKNHRDRVKVHINCTATGIYKEDGVVSCVIGEEEYFRIKPERIVMATGAQERLIPFPNNHLPGVYGAGAVQTLMNVYGVIPGKRVLMVGAGNIGLIVSYQLIQAGVEIAGIVEAMDKVGGYWVHAAKVRRLGVPIFLRHTIKEALGDRVVTGALIQEIDDRFQPVGREKKIDADIICMAVGLTPTCELLWQAGCEMIYVPQLCGHVALRDQFMRTSLPHVWVAGDAAGIEEATAAMVEGRIAGLDAARSLGKGDKEDLTERLEDLQKRLGDLRGGEVGQKICQGLACCSIQGWGA
ncbi:MAG: Hydrogen cyanide synthase subunit HcnB [Synergistetes bacterium ADurb.Bin155]|nr:MAG: Hydrogen cyanide synthase subunit HcnB [Synergistetes bacterium ADurb.Bin155]